MVITEIIKMLTSTTIKQFSLTIHIMLLQFPLPASHCYLLPQILIGGYEGRQSFRGRHAVFLTRNPRGRDVSLSLFLSSAYQPVSLGFTLKTHFVWIDGPFVLLNPSNTIGVHTHAK